MVNEAGNHHISCFDYSKYRIAKCPFCCLPNKNDNVYGICSLCESSRAELAGLLRGIEKI